METTSCAVCSKDEGQEYGHERLGDEYRKASGSDIFDDILLTTLVRALPRPVQQHIQLGMTNTTTYQEVKDRLVAYERVSSSWSFE